jgi:hypothetical protein
VATILRRRYFSHLFKSGIMAAYTTPSDEELEILLEKLTREERVSLLAAVDWWRTPIIKRDDVFVPHIKVG